MLPKISQPLYEIVQPSTGDQLQVRPFLVKEEKILLGAKESGDNNDVYMAIKQIVNNCVTNEGFDVNDIPIVDMNYIFIKLRAMSVSPVVKFKVQDSTDNIEYDLEMDLNEVEVKTNEDHTMKIDIDDNIGIMMKYPTPSLSEKIKNIDTEVELTTATIEDSVDYVWDADDVYPWKEISQAEKTSFLDELPITVYKKIQTFYDTAPKIEHVVTYENSEGTEKRVVFRDLNDFFTLA
jgi:hypothetical protein